MNITFYVLAPYLFSMEGHEYNYCFTLHSILKKMGIKHALLVKKNISLLPECSICYFQRVSWKDYFCLFRKKEKTKCVFFHESFTSKEFLIISTLALLTLRKKDALILLFRYGKHQLPLKGFGHAVLINILKWRLRHRFIPVTDSELIAQEFNIDLMPIPHAEKNTYSSAEHICWWPGPPRAEKGLHIISQIAPYRGKFKLALSSSAGIECDYPLDVELSPSEYRAWMAKSCVILLPYDSNTYKSGTSGIFIEAVVAGKMPIVKKGSWLAYELTRFDLTELIVDWSPDTIFSQIDTQLANPEVIQKLKIMQDAYSNYHNLHQYAQNLQKHLSSIAD